MVPFKRKIDDEAGYAIGRGLSPSSDNTQGSWNSDQTVRLRENMDQDSVATLPLLA